MKILVLSIFISLLKGAFIPAVLICVQVKLSMRKKITGALVFIGIIAVIFAVNYICLSHAAPKDELKRLSLTLQGGNQAELYVRENEEGEIIAYSAMKIVNKDGTVIAKEEGSPLESPYRAVISEMTGGRSLYNAVFEDEEILSNPRNRFFEYGGKIYIISAERLLEYLTPIIVALIFIFGISRFLQNRQTAVISRK